MNFVSKKKRENTIKRFRYTKYTDQPGPPGGFMPDSKLLWALHNSWIFYQLWAMTFIILWQVIWQYNTEHFWTTLMDLLLTKWGRTFVKLFLFKPNVLCNLTWTIWNGPLTLWLYRTPNLCLYILWLRLLNNWTVIFNLDNPLCGQADCDHLAPQSWQQRIILAQHLLIYQISKTMWKWLSWRHSQTTLQ